MTPSRVAIVKLGGSLASSPSLRAWLDVFAGAGAGRMVIVPGGGPFADAVRAVQQRQGFDDASAHHMALLAMEQYGRMLTGMRPGLVAADSGSAIGYALARGEVPVWMPSKMVLASADIPANWNVTSDSLAAWLAAQLHATLLVLVKSVEVTEAHATLTELVSRGWVDPEFPRFAAAAGCPVRILGSDDHPVLTRMLVNNELKGLEVLR
jgi:5-(aminomethyl)-3-furanmethanol phosphate kinase